MLAQRLSLTMNTTRTPRTASRSEGPSATADRLAVWILLALGLLLMLVSAGKAEQPTATRVDRFQGPLPPGQTLHVENITGDIVVSAGKEFSAVVTVTVSAATREKAEEILGKTRVVGDHEDGWSLQTRWPGMRQSGRREGRHASLCSSCKIVARYEIVVPPGITAELQTVNGDVRVADCDGTMTLTAVNGSIDVRGVRRSLEAQTVNGKISAAAGALARDASVELKSVNGNVTLTLPPDAKFDLAASTMNGSIASTFPLPVRAPQTLPEETLHREVKGAHAPRIIVSDEDGETTVMDVREFEHEMSESMKEIRVQIEEGMRDAEQGIREAERGIREAERELRRVRIDTPGRQYSGSIGKGGVRVQLSTLNGNALLLAAGTKEADAKPLVTERRSFVVTIPKVEVHVGPGAPHVAPVAPVPPVPPEPAIAPLPPLPPFEGEVIRGDISGDFVSTSTGGSYRVGNVSGRVTILTQSGEIHVRSAGAGADLKSLGGDIVIGPVNGDLKASTMAGDIRAGAVTGSALADTAGGDIRIDRIAGNLDAKTAGGDVVVPRVGGGVRAATAGGDIRIGMASRDLKGGVTIRNSGGDVSIWLPADCKADVEMIVEGADEDDTAIRSDFGNLTVSKRPGYQRATLSLNGGGERVVIRTSSGTIRLKKGTPSQ